ncbi:MAG: hypothetical protein IKD04_08220 [Clostridia bacterium]|nr:hypothetical protein [Clostridia bacterium]
MENFLLGVTIFTDPIETFYMVQLNRSRKFSYVFPTILLLLFFGVRILQIYCTHYPLATVQSWEANIVIEIGKFVVPIVSWIIASYAVTSLMDGEAMVREVYLGSTLCLLPYIVFMPIIIALSHCMSSMDSGIYNFLIMLVWAWVIILMFLQTMYLNDYTLGKTIGVVILSLISIVVLWVIAILVFSLAKQFIDFIFGLYREFRINFL